MYPQTPGAKFNKRYQVKQKLDDIEEIIVFEEDFQKAYDQIMELKDDDFNSKEKKKKNLLLAFCLNKMAKPNETLELIEPIFNEAKEINDTYTIINAAIPFASSCQKLAKIDQGFEIIEFVEKYIKKQNYEIRDVVSQRNFASMKNTKGILYWMKGDIVNAQRSFQESLDKYIELNDERYKGTLMNNIGNIHIFLGDINSAVELYKQSLDIRKKLKDKFGMATTLANIAESLIIQDKLRESHDHFIESMEIFKELDNPIFLSQTYYHLIRILLQLQEKEKSLVYFSALSKLNDEQENAKIDVYYKLSQAVLLQSNDRLFDKFEAGLIYREIKKQNIELPLKFNAALEYINILLLELKLTEKDILVEEIVELVEDLQKTAKKYKSLYLELQVNILLANIYLITYQINKASNLLRKTIQKAEENELFKYGIVASISLDNITKNSSRWEELRKENAPINERLKLIELEGIIKTIIENKSTQLADDLEPEEPMLLSLFTDSGLSLYSYSFTSEKKADDQLLAGFLTAINTFGKDLFDHQDNIEQIKYGDSIITLKKEKNITISYLYKGNSYYALKNVNNFIEELKKAQDIYVSITESSLPDISGLFVEQINSIVKNNFKLATN